MNQPTNGDCSDHRLLWQGWPKHYGDDHGVSNNKNKNQGENNRIKSRREDMGSYRH